MTITLYMHLPTYENEGCATSFYAYMHIEVDTATNLTPQQAADKIIAWKAKYNLYDKQNWWIGQHLQSNHP